MPPSQTRTFRRRRLLLLGALSLSPLLVERLAADIVQWDLENDLEATRGPGPLLEGSAPGAGVDYVFEEADIGGAPANVVHFQKGTWLHLLPGLPPNGLQGNGQPAQYVNQYTLIMDVMFPNRNPDQLADCCYTSLYQTNASNSNDGDWFIDPAGALGISGVYGGSIPDMEWHRIARVVDLQAGVMTSYLDGVQVQQTAGEAIDGRFALYSVNDGGIDGILLFADESGDDSEGYLNSVQFRDTVMTEAEIAALGGPTAEGIPLPADPRDCLLRTFKALFDAATGTVTGSWSLLPGDEGFHVVQGARLVGGTLAADVTTFEDTSAPLGGLNVVYTLQPLKGGKVERSCDAPAIQTFGCSSGLTSCIDQAARTVSFAWKGPSNITLERYSLKRDGVEVAQPAGTATSASDPSPVAPGNYLYELTAVAGGQPLCPLATRVVVTGHPILPAGECGGLVALYDFNGDLKSSTFGRDLVPAVSPPLLPNDPPGVTFESFELGGETGTACRYSRGTYFQLFTGFGPNGQGPNGPGQYTNLYTLILDVKFEAGALDASGWASLYNTNTQDANDGDWFVRSPDMGIGISGNYGGEIPAGEWHRLALSVDDEAGIYQSYIDGILVQENGGGVIDDRFSLYSVNDGPLEGILLFADESGDNAEGLVGSAQIRDRALSGGEIAAFGGPSASGIPIDPPCPNSLVCSVDQSARKAILTWKKGSSGKGGGTIVRRDGATVATLPVGAESYTDSALAPGAYIYEVSLNDKDVGCPNLPLVCQAEVLGDRLFFEDFDSYADDAALAAAGWQATLANSPEEPSGWTLANPGRRPNPPTSSGLPTNGKFAISDSAAGPTPATLNTAGSGMSYDLVSPSFSTLGAGPVVLHLDVSAQLGTDLDASAVLDLDVSTDGGTSWSNVFERVSPVRATAPLPEFAKNADGLFGRLNLDLSAAASNEASVRLRFRHFEPVRDLWIALDNVLVDRHPAAGGSAVPLANVDFAGGIPAGWAAVSGPLSDGTAPWSGQDGCGLSLLASGGTFPDNLNGQALHYLGDHFALVDASCSLVKEDEYLVTPSLDLSALGAVFLQVNSATLPARGALAEILLSLDGGSTFLPRPVFAYSGGGLIAANADPVYGNLVLAVPRAAGQARAAFAFHFRSAGDAGGPPSWWAIDDVRVSGDPPTGPRFIRGDADGNGKIEVTDPLRLLNFLFLGEFIPGSDPHTIECLDAADVDDNGKLEVTDAINNLNFQFLGGEKPRPPYPACGLDPEPDESPSLGCVQPSASCQ